MKKTISIFISLILVTMIFTGCGETKEKNVETAVTETETADIQTNQDEPAEAVTEPVFDECELIAKYEHFAISSENLRDGKWDDVISNTEKGENKSPELTWEPVDGASLYMIYMVDTSMQDWIHWKSADITETSLPTGWAPESDYVGPYPPAGGTHTYEIFVIAIKNPVERMKGGLNSQNMKFAEFIDALDTDKDGNTGNIVACGHIAATFTN